MLALIDKGGEEAHPLIGHRSSSSARARAATSPNQGEKAGPTAKAIPSGDFVWFPRLRDVISDVI
jgi:hypothetical protein